MKKYIPEKDPLALAIALAAIGGSVLLSSIIPGAGDENRFSRVVENLVGALFLGGPLAVLFFYYASALGEGD